MATKTFGKRGAAMHTAAPALEASAAAAAMEPPNERSQALRHLEEFYPEKDVLAMIPVLTLVMIAFLLIVFGVERRLAFDIAPDGSLSIESLLALGAVSYDLVIRFATCRRRCSPPSSRTRDATVKPGRWPPNYARQGIRTACGRCW